MKKVIAIIIAIISVLSIAVFINITYVPESNTQINFWESKLWDLPTKGANW